MVGIFWEYLFIITVVIPLFTLLFFGFSKTANKFDNSRYVHYVSQRGFIK